MNNCSARFEFWKVAQAVIFGFIALASFLPGRAAAQLHVFDCAKSKPLPAAELSSAVDAVQKRYGELNSFKANFIQYSYLAALEVSELSSGKIAFSKPGKMRWQYEKPDEQIFVTNDQTLWFYQPNDKQVLIDNFRDAFSSDVPVSFLMGLGSLTAAFRPVSGCKTVDGVVLELAPKAAAAADQEQPLRTMKLLVDLKDHTPNGAQIVDVAGNINSFIFGKLEPNAQVAGTEFKLDIPKGVDVIDRRNL